MSSDGDRSGTHGLLTLEQAGARIGLSVVTLRRRISAGALPAARLGRRVLVRPADVDRLVDFGDTNGAHQRGV